MNFLKICCIILIIISCEKSKADIDNEPVSKQPNLNQTSSDTPNALTENETVNFSQSGKNKALLIGINSYPEFKKLNKDKDLQACLRDVELMQKLLTEKFDFRDNDIITLTDAQATRQNILKRFDALIRFYKENEAKDGQAVFYYSGHGTRTPDLNSDEGDGLDEALVPHDSDGCKNLIIDDELDEKLRQLTAVCKNVTIITDCCNSGSGFRGEISTSLVPRLAMCEEHDHSLPAGSVDPNNPSGFLPPNPNYVHIAASRDRQFSYEDRAIGYGILTYTLNEVIRRNPRATYRQMMREVHRKVSTKYAQEPQLEGPRRDDEIFGSSGKVEKFVEVANVNGKTIELKAGQAHGVTEGSIYAIYPPNATSLEAGHIRLAVATIFQVDPFASFAQLETDVSIPENAVAFEIAHNYGNLQLRLAIELDEAPQLRQKALDILTDYKEKEDLVALVSKGEKDFDVSLRVYDKDPNKIEFLRGDTRTFKTLNKSAKSLEDSLTLVLTREARRLNLVNLENKVSNLAVSITMKRWEKVGTDAGGYEFPVNPIPLSENAGGQLVFDAGNAVEMRIKNESDVPLHFYIFDIATDGGVYLRYPAVGAQDSPLQPHKEIKNAMKITPPAGLNIIKVIATTHAADFWVFTQKGSQPRSISKGANESPLSILMNYAWGGTRNLETMNVREIGDWTTKDVVFLIE